MGELEDRIGYRFSDSKNLELALTHSSYSNEMRSRDIQAECNERLEFLGDSVLSIVTSEYLYSALEGFPEGDLSKIRASAVCEKSLHKLACSISLGDHLFLGRGEEQTNGRQRPSILADAFEAILAAMFIDGGMDVAKKHVLRFIVPELENSEYELFNDYKTLLQEVIQRNPEERLSYVLINETGPDHDKRFTVEVHLNSNVIGTGIGKSKKQAEQHAAKAMIER